MLRLNPSMTSSTVLAQHGSGSFSNLQMSAVAKPSCSLCPQQHFAHQHELSSHALRLSSCIPAHCSCPQDTNTESTKGAVTVSHYYLSHRKTVCQHLGKSLSTKDHHAQCITCMVWSLDYGTNTTSNTGRIRPTLSAGNKSQYEQLFPLKLPFKTLWWPLTPVPGIDAPMVRHCSGRCFIHCSQCFQNCDLVQCQIWAGEAAHVKHLQTILWVRNLRCNAVKGVLQGVHD
jgi:hypothetical protein